MASSKFTPILRIAFALLVAQTPAAVHGAPAQPTVSAGSSAHVPHCPTPEGLASWQRIKREADTAYSQNNYGVAERGFQDALKHAEKLGPNNIHIAETLHCLVALHITRGQFTKAEPLFERELRVKEKALGPEHPEVVATVGRLAEFYLDHGNPTKADRLTNLLAGFSDRKVKDQQAMKDTFGKIKKYYDKSIDYAEAQAQLKRLEETTHRITAQQDLELATTMDALGRLYQTREKLDVAERMYKGALALRQRTLAPEHMALAYSFENLANLYTIQGKQELAQSYMKQSLEVTEKTLQPGRPEFFHRLDSLAKTHSSMGHNGDAESLYKKALAIIDKSSPNSYDAGKASFALATLYLKQGRAAEAEPLMKRALKGAEGANGPEHAAVAPILDTYAEVLDKLNKTGDAARLRARSRAIRGVQVSQSSSDF
jgi:tetratricopeptide (TPR) repeat protein